MLIVTGASGFIGSRVVSALAEKGPVPIAVHRKGEYRMLPAKTGGTMLSSDLPLWLSGTYEAPWIDKNVEGIVHLGAITDTMLADEKAFAELNTEYSKALWTWCAERGKPLVVASSAATYGNGVQGFSDDEGQLSLLEPLNAYAKSKHEFDLWAVSQEKKPPFWAILKFFNVYGENEGHKGKMASMVYKACQEASKTGCVTMFKDGEQKRDFVYVGDVVKVVLHMVSRKPASGVYNVGAGKARSFNEMANAVFKGLDKTPSINYIDMPEELRPRYQTLTEAPIGKLRNVGEYGNEFMCLEDGAALVAKGFRA